MLFPNGVWGWHPRITKVAAKLLSRGVEQHPGGPRRLVVVRPQNKTPFGPGTFQYLRSHRHWGGTCEVWIPESWRLHSVNHRRRFVGVFRRRGGGGIVDRHAPLPSPPAAKAGEEGESSSSSSSCTESRNFWPVECDRHRLSQPTDAEPDDGLFPLVPGVVRKAGRPCPCPQNQHLVVVVVVVVVFFFFFVVFGARELRGMSFTSSGLNALPDPTQLLPANP